MMEAWIFLFEKGSGSKDKEYHAHQSNLWWHVAERRQVYRVPDRVQNE